MIKPVHAKSGANFEQSKSLLTLESICKFELSDVFLSLKIFEAGLILPNLDLRVGEMRTGRAATQPKLGAGDNEC